MLKFNIRLLFVLALVLALLVGTVWNRFQRSRERRLLLEHLAASIALIGPPPICGRDPVLDAWAGDVRQQVLDPLRDSQRGFFERLFYGSAEMMVVKHSDTQQGAGDGVAPDEDSDLKAFLSGEGVF